MIKRAIHFQVINLDIFDRAARNDVGVVCVEVVSCSGPRLRIASAYCPPRVSGGYTERTFWTNFFEGMERQRVSVICGDFNGHSGLWSARSGIVANAEGSRIEAAVSDSHFTCLNSGEDTWFSSDLNSSSALDLTFVSPEYATRSDWRLMDYLYGSDHFPIHLTIDGVSVGGVPCRPSFSLGRVDWADFRRRVAQIYGPSDGVAGDDLYSYDVLYQNLRESVLAAGRKLRNTNRFSRRAPTIWWNTECADLINQKRAAFRVFKSSPSIDNLGAYKELCKFAKKRLAAIRRDSFREFCTGMDPSMNSASLWRNIKVFSRGFRASTSGTGSITRRRTRVVEAFDRTVPVMAPSCSAGLARSSAHEYTGIDLGSGLTAPGGSGAGCDRPVPSGCFSGFSVARPFSGDLVRAISLNEIKTAVSSLRIKSAVGPDLISNLVISNLPPEGLSALGRVFNGLWHRGAFLPSWQNYYMVFIPKPDKDDFRPISLASSIAKVFEKVMQVRLEWWAERYGHIPVYQSSFRRGRTGLDNLSILTSDIRGAMISGFVLGAVFLDIRGAFDNVVPAILLEILARLGLPVKVLRLLTS